MSLSFLEWRHADAEGFGQQLKFMRHRLHETSFFSDSALARLIEGTPRENFHVNTMRRDSSNPRSWREGDMVGLSGEDVLKAVAKGNIWVHLQRVHEVSEQYRSMLEGIFAEIEQNVPKFKSFKRSMSVLISSPRMNVAYHADVPGQSLWQVRGLKRVWVYPARAPFLPQRAIEKIVLKRVSDTDFSYDPSFDDEAQTYDLIPGDWATWPQNCPHRVVNADCLNVSVTTEHWTRDLRAGYTVNYANGLLRSFFPDRALSQNLRGPAFWAKFCLTGAHKALHRTKKIPVTIDFRVDPSAPEGFMTTLPYQILK